MLFGGMALQVSGLYYTTASNSAFITGLNVVMVPIVSSFLLKKKPDVFSTIGVILAFLGMFLLSMGETFFINGGGLHFNFGDFLTLLCAVCFTLQIIFIDKFTNDQEPSSLAVIQIGFAAVLYTTVWLGMDFKQFEINSTVIVTLIITGVFGTALAFAGQTAMQRFTSPTHTALILAAEPLFGALFAILIPNSQGVTENLKFNSILGCSLILIGMLISELKVGKRNNHDN
ncbi:MAG: permease [Clostridiales bacterium]|jgi:drug/metabolite transporter (DMT)-like permease|nr:permease [Clostridiales bacterium]